MRVPPPHTHAPTPAQIACFEVGGKSVSILASNLRHVRTLRSPGGVVQAVTYLPTVRPAPGARTGCAGVSLTRASARVHARVRGRDAQTQQFVASSNNLEVAFYAESSGRLLQSFATPSNQVRARVGRAGRSRAEAVARRTRTRTHTRARTRADVPIVYG